MQTLKLFILPDFQGTLFVDIFQDDHVICIKRSEKGVTFSINLICEALKPSCKDSDTAQRFTNDKVK